MIAVLFLLALLANPSQSWLLEASHTSIQVGVTKDVTITCKYDDNDLGKAPIKNVLRIVIKRLKDDKTVATYKIRIGMTKAEADRDGANPDLSVKGHIDEAKNSFLSLAWSKPSQDAVGEYQCQIQGYTKDDTYVIVNASPVAVKEGGSSTGSSCGCTQLSNALLDLKKRFDESQKESTVSQSVVDELKTKLMIELKKRLDGFQNDFDNELDLLEKKVALVKTGSGKSESKGIKWPGGQYALLNTEDGCPTSTTSGWQVGFIRFHAYSSNSQLSYHNHMAGPVISNAINDNSFTFRTCKRGSDSHVNAWPKGSYCVHRDGGRCPAGFRKGEINMRAGRKYRYRRGSNEPDMKWTFNLSHLTLYFCCRGDQDPLVPMTLPTDDPFLLYRYKGKCQQVKGTKVVDEWFVVDTGNWPSTDQDSYNGYKPDCKRTPMRMYMCYYTPLP